MGRQINFYMEHAAFLPIAEQALALGCEIVCTDKKRGLLRGFSAELIQPEQIYYHFHVPAAGELAVVNLYGRAVLSPRAAGKQTLIEAGFSCISEAEKRISRARLYCSSGCYDDSGTWIPLPECTAEIYKKLVRTVKKAAPYTEFEIGGEMRKKYVTPHCLELYRQGYALF